jgi:hypothetical protein
MPKSVHPASRIPNAPIPQSFFWHPLFALVMSSKYCSNCLQTRLLSSFLLDHLIRRVRSLKPMLPAGCRLQSRERSWKRRRGSPCNLSILTFRLKNDYLSLQRLLHGRNLLQPDPSICVPTRPPVIPTSSTSTWTLNPRTFTPFILQPPQPDPPICIPTPPPPGFLPPDQWRWFIAVVLSRNTYNRRAGYIVRWWELGAVFSPCNSR